MITRILNRLLPRSVMASLTNFRTLSIEFGQARTMREQRCVDRDGQPIPWYTYPAIEYLNQIDLTDKTVFEFGSGNSTLFWSRKAKHVVAVEDNEEWYNRMKGQLPGNVDYHFARTKEEYVQCISRQVDRFDIIIIDGNHRLDCTQASLGKLKQNGFFILDNSDWFEISAKLLRESDFIEVDMAGFGPINAYTWTTSFFLSRSVSLKPAHDRQPAHGIGSLKHTEG